MLENEKILFHRLLWVLSDRNSELDAETIELILHDLAKTSGKSQNEIIQMIDLVI
jgi:hypothetical protein